MAGKFARRPGGIRVWELGIDGVMTDFPGGTGKDDLDETRPMRPVMIAAIVSHARSTAPLPRRTPMLPCLGPLMLEDPS